jgi:hypothetical protein
MRRTGRYRTLRIPVYDRFAPALTREAPAAYAIDSARGDLATRLRLHGVTVERLAEAAPHASVSRFALDSVRLSSRQFQGHREARYFGRWERGKRTLPAGTYIVPAAQARGVLAMYLLEPESDDGLGSWNAFGDSAAADIPVLRIEAPLGVARHSLP